MRKRLRIALVILLLLIPLAYSLRPYKPDFVVRYDHADPQELEGIEYTFVDLFDVSVPCGEKSFAYVDFGTAEDYRRYRENVSDIIGDELSDRPGEYYVKVRSPKRLGIMRQWIDMAYEAGFYGVLLDNVETYEYRQEHGYEDAYELYLEALRNVTAYAHSLGMRVIINLGGALEYIANATFVDGFMREDVFLYEGSPAPRDPYEVLSRLSKAKSEGKLVFVVEYAKDAKEFLEVKEKLSDFLLFVTDEPYTYSHMPRRYREPRIVIRLSSLAVGEACFPHTASACDRNPRR